LRDALRNYPHARLLARATAAAAMLNVVVVGCGFAGLELGLQLDALCADGRMQCTFIEKEKQFTPGAFHQFVLAGTMEPDAVARPYSAWKAKHVRLVHDEVVKIDTARRQVLTQGGAYDYDELVLAPGVQTRPDLLPGAAA
jgi:NADH dehydrogenase